MSLRRIALLVILALALSACGAKKPPTPAAQPEPIAATPVPTFTATVVIPRATITPSPTPTASSTLTPAPTHTPTATPLASVRLAQGRYYQSIGDCATARREFAAVVADGAAEITEARYRLALCYLRDAAAAEAAGVLTQLLAAAPISDTYRAPATFLLGDAQAAQARWSDAEASYTAYLPRVPELSALTWQRIAAMRQAAGNLPAATEAYSAALQTAPDWESAVAIRRNLADLALIRKDFGAAVTQYDALRGGLTTGPWAAEMQWLAGATLAQATAPAAPSDEAKRRWQAAADADPTSAYAHRGIAALVDAGVAVDEYQRGVINYFNEKYELANAAFERLRATDPTGRGGDAWYYAGLSLLKRGQTDLGLAELGNLIAAYPDNSHWADAWLAQADARARTGDLPGALAAYRQFAAQRPDAPQAATALWRAANLQAETGAIGAAAEAYTALGRKYPLADEAWRSYQAAGLIYFTQADWRRAAEVWQEMADANLAAFTKPVAYYWLGRAQAAGGDSATARQSWQRADQADPNSYYGWRARAWLEKAAAAQSSKPTVTPPGATTSGAATPTAQPQTEREALAAWLRSWAGEGSLVLPATVTADPDWRRGQALLDLGRRAQGLAAWGRVQAKQAKAPWTLAALALTFRDLGANRLAILSAEQVADLTPAGNLYAAPAALQHLAYPLPFADLLRAEASNQSLDPLLLASVIRQESRFESVATSTAGAQGLMQVMPATAEWIAARLGRSDFTSAQAYWPYVNVSFGAYYLSWGLQQFDGSLTTALAGYNGGPGNAARWRKLAPTDDDLMVALIDYGETRIYVQQVSLQYEMYQRIYSRAAGS